MAGVNALGRGQDRESLTAFIGTIAQTLGPEALVKYIDASEAIKRLAAAQGIDVLNLVKTPQQMQQDMQQQQAMATTINCWTGWTDDVCTADGSNKESRCC